MRRQHCALELEILEHHGECGIGSNQFERVTGEAKPYKLEETMAEREKGVVVCLSRNDLNVITIQQVYQNTIILVSSTMLGA